MSELLLQLTQNKQRSQAGSRDNDNCNGNYNDLSDDGDDDEMSHDSKDVSNNNKEIGSKEHPISSDRHNSHKGDDTLLHFCSIC